MLCIIPRFTRLSGLITHACSKTTGQQSQDLSKDQAGILRGQDSCCPPQDRQQGRSFGARTSQRQSKAGGEIHSAPCETESCGEARQGLRNQGDYGSKEAPKGGARTKYRNDGQPQSQRRCEPQTVANKAGIL